MKSGLPGRVTGRTLLLSCSFILVGISLTMAGHLALEQTNSVEFCTSCHTMSIPFEEYQQSLHYRNKFGTPATCPDCHVPRETGPLLLAKLRASRDVWHELLGTIDTQQKYEAHRWRMANRVWDKMIANDSRECRDCHVFSQMDLEAQERRTAKKHRQAEAEGETCIICHKGIVHKLPDPPQEETQVEG